jgi:hypothetical protein
MKFSLVVLATIASASALNNNVVARNAALDARSYSPSGYGDDKPADYSKDSKDDKKDNLPASYDGKKDWTKDDAKPEDYSKDDKKAGSKPGKHLTTKIVYETKLETVTSCAPEKTDCPTNQKEHVVTHTVPAYTTICPEDEVAPTPHPAPTAAPVYDSAKPAGGHYDDEVCEEYVETCTETVTAPKAGYHANVTAPAAPVYHPQGTGSPVEPTKAYYSNPANKLAGGAFAMGAGALAALFM